jgi:hypothetical protein
LQAVFAHRCEASAQLQEPFPATKPALGQEQESEIELGEVVADIFHGASPEAEPLGLHRQILTQLRVAISEVVSDYSDSAFNTDRLRPIWQVKSVVRSSAHRSELRLLMRSAL